MFTLRVLAATAMCCSLALTSLPVSSDPGNGKGPDKGHAQGGKGQGNKADQGHKNQDSKGNQGNKGKGQQEGEWGRSPHIDRDSVLGILAGHRNDWQPGPSLPPGIQKNLARGKPLPPGIAKKLDGRLLTQLPHYEGYEWQQAGADLILVSIASGLIYEVLNGAFD
ncbi:anti-virulence regulator CigR family protein [Pseudomonas lundensis]|jgi:hypothetical protein|uniref:Integral membrane protein n=1 Tax=Pseudomonas lundensis TaxID=86185 RepID=A0AAP7ZUU7_9PSED|nr:RcnB family protein [Pseudomonas lundensis]NMZ55848.1 RcnB family protein [Pseudomonas lundensis]NNA01371.1 RcnB family protein [Pseudomonas lundensis]NNA17105.1 RcnB family protein [Pseudomonas lundensis]OZY27139.1 hypothetical protein CJF40_16635 [Pseudomonas lundensis]